jgi:hypothetical protein
MHPSADSDDYQLRNLVFHGGRFDIKGVPVTGLVEILRYQKLFQEIGKDVWHEIKGADAPIPRFLEDLLQLRITQLEDGSVDTMVRPEFGSALQYEDDDAVVDTTLDRIDQIFDQMVAGIDVGHDFSNSSRNALKEVGQGFRGDECLSFAKPGQEPVTYTRELRRRAIRSLDAGVATHQGRLLGKITRLNTDAYTFTFRLSSGRNVNGRAFASAIPDLKAALDIPGTNVLNVIECSFRVRGDSGPIAITNVSGVQVFDCPEEEAPRLIRLAEMPSGWLDGHGEAVQLPALERTRDLLKLIKDLPLSRPGLFPRPDGGVNVEWLSNTAHVVVEVDPSGMMEAYAYAGGETLVELQPLDAAAALNFAEEKFNG